jgi:cob(I)alamin adenosyltransferase
MSISTKGGDGGKTSLMFGRRVSKNCRRVCAYGAVDEFSSAFGLARSFSDDPVLGEAILTIQKNLIKLMTELATSAEDFPKLAEKGIPLLSDEDLNSIESQVKQLEGNSEGLKEWQIPGSGRLNGALNLARAICRRAEREIVALDEEEPLPRKMPIIYINRLADLIFLWACNN